MSEADTLSNALTGAEIARLREMIEREAIYDNIVKYCRGQDRADLELLKDSYWEDGTDDHGQYVGSAHGFCEMSIDTRDMFRSVNHHIGNTQIEFIGDNQAKAETYFICVLVWADPDRTGEDVDWFLAGRYRDLHEKRNGEWKILRRVCIWDWNQEHPHLSNWSRGGIPDNSNWGKRSKDDPIYQAW